MILDRFRLLFFGSDAFSVRVLEPILRQSICPIRVVTKPHTLLSRYANQHKLVQHDWNPGLYDIKNYEFNIGIVASFGKMIDPTTVDRFKYGLFNTHPSLLPRYRGSTPIQTAVFNGDKLTGCTIMRIPPIEKFDIGDVVSQQKLVIKHREYAIELRDRLAGLGSAMVMNFLLNYESHISRIRSQSPEGKSLARKIQPQQGLLSFKSDNADLIDRKLLAYTGFIEIYTKCLNGLKVCLENPEDPELVRKLDIDRLAARLNDHNTVEPGTIYFHKLRRLLCIKACDGNWTAFDWVQPEARPPMSALEFYNGYLSKIAPGDRTTDV